jgi:hypothetical protein
MLFLLFLILIHTACSKDLILSSSRLTIRPTENAYAFGVISNEKIDYFNCTIGNVKLYDHNNTINWAWKIYIDYDTKNFTTTVNIFKNNLLYTIQLHIKILEYIPRITVDNIIVGVYGFSVENSGTFYGNSVTSNVGIIKTQDNMWRWHGKTIDLFKNYNTDYIYIIVYIDLSISNNFVVCKKDFVFNKISYYLYIPNYVHSYIVENDFVDIWIVKIGTSIAFNIDESKIFSEEIADHSINNTFIIDNNTSYYSIFKISILFISEDKALYIRDKLFEYIEDGTYFNKITNRYTNDSKNMFLLENPIIEFSTYKSSDNILQISFLSLLLLSFFSIICTVLFSKNKKNIIPIEKNKDKDFIIIETNTIENNTIENNTIETNTIETNTIDNITDVSSITPQNQKIETIVHNNIIEDESWIPYDEKIKFNIETVYGFQKTHIYTLIGNRMKNNLIEPVNYKSITYSVLWEAIININNESIYIEGIIPYNNFSTYIMNGYQIQMLIGKHKNILNILHNFVGSSILVYPFSNNEKIRNYTTYFVTKKYNKLIEYKPFTEKQLCIFILQIFKAIEHLSLFNISHCNINEYNILIEDDTVMISDFSNSVPCLTINTNDILSQIFYRLNTYNTGQYSPEISKFLRMDPEKIYIEDTDFWNIFYKNDTYIIGKMIYRIIDNDIVYSNRFLSLLQNLVNENFKERIEVEDIIYEIQQILRG